MEPKAGVSLEHLLRALAQNTRVIGPRDKQITAMTIDSREARAGSLFVALRGEHTDGHRFIGDAVARGCEVVVMESLDTLGMTSEQREVTLVVVPDSARALVRRNGRWTTPRRSPRSCTNCSRKCGISAQRP